MDGGASDASQVRCEGGESACADACVDVSSDPDHCGRCDHACLGGACAAGVCQPVTLASDLAIPQGLAVGPDGVYVTLYSGNAVVRIPKEGGEPAVVSTDTRSPWGVGLAIEGGKTKRIIWGENRGAASNIVFFDPTSGTAKKTATNADVWQIAITSMFAYFTTSSGTSGAVQRCSLDGCGSAPSSVISGAPNVFGLVVTGSQLAFGLRDSVGAVRRASVDGTGVTTLMASLASPTLLATDGADVFAAVTGANVIARCPLSGCVAGQKTTIAAAENPHDVATDGANVYFTNGKAVGGFVSWCPVAGCAGGGQVLAADQANPYTIVVDDEAVYWTNSSVNGQVMKVARP